MNLDKLRTGEKIAGVSAVLLLIAMFFDWFGVEVPGSTGTVPGVGTSAWAALGFMVVVLAVTIVVSLINTFLRLRGSNYEPSLSLNVVVAILGGLSALLILFRVAVQPDFGSFGGLPIEATPEPAIFVGLLTAAGIAFGGYRAMQEEGTTFSSAADKLAAARDPRKS